MSGSERNNFKQMYENTKDDHGYHECNVNIGGHIYQEPPRINYGDTAKRSWDQI